MIRQSSADSAARAERKGTITSPFLVLFIPLLAFIGCAAPVVPKPAVMRPAEEATASRLEAARKDPAALHSFFRRMPKGGDLHVHSSGAIYPETLLRLAADRGLCVNPVSGDLHLPPCGPRVNGHSLAVSSTIGDQAMKERLVDLWSVRNLSADRKAAHDHFFAVFRKTGPATEEIPAILADLRERAARDNIQYLEVMFRIRSADQKAAELGRTIGWDEDPARLRDRLLTGGLAALVTEVSAGIASRHGESLQRLGCDSAEARPGCGVLVRYQQYANRTLPKEAVFAQLVLAFEVVRTTPLVVGVNLVGQEDHPTAVADYSRQMKMLEDLHGLYPRVRIALHAGELIPELVPADALRSHIREAVRTGHADRIGNAVGINHEAAAAQTLREMADRRVAVEIMPSSSNCILALNARTHPFPVFLEAGVPAVLATDNPGILLTDLTDEFAVMAIRYPRLTWRDFKTFARNSLEFSFLAGNSLWKAKGCYEEMVKPCGGGEPGKADPSPACTGFLSENRKAALQWELETKLASFEQ